MKTNCLTQTISEEKVRSSQMQSQESQGTPKDYISWSQATPPVRKILTARKLTNYEMVHNSLETSEVYSVSSPQIDLKLVPKVAYSCRTQ